MAAPYLRPREGGCVLAVRAAPRASRSGVAGPLGGELKISLNAPPADGAANRELVKLLSKLLHIPKSDIEILTGETSRSKTVLLRGLDMADAERALSGGA